jgi:hypothetical protein
VQAYPVQGLDDLSYDFGFTEEPTAVWLTYLTAVRSGSSDALVEWQTLIELDMVGFNLYRSTHPEGLDKIRLNDQLIAAQAFNQLDGATYQYLDSTIQPETRQFYWLEIIESSNQTWFWDEAPSIMPGLSRLYLPMFRR